VDFKTVSAIRATVKPLVILDQISEWIKLLINRLILIDFDMRNIKFIYCLHVLKHFFDFCGQKCNILSAVGY